MEPKSPVDGFFAWLPNNPPELAVEDPKPEVAAGAVDPNRNSEGAWLDVEPNMNRE